MRYIWHSLARILLATAAALALLFGLAAVAITQPTFGVRVSRNGPRADPSRLRRDVQRLTDLAPRDSDHPERLDAAATYLRQGFAPTSARVFDQTFAIRGRTYRNVVADFGPAAGPLLVVGAHYDSFGEFGPNPGADDNASGAAGLLELARLLGNRSSRPPSTRVELVAYANEEPPWFGSSAMGSAVHARSLRGQTVRGMICLEMIGYFTPRQPAPNLLFRLLYPRRGNFIAVVSRWTDRSLTRDAKLAIQGTGFPAVSLIAPRDAGIDASDQRSYWDLGIPAVMVTDTSFVRNPSYHTPGDTAASLDYVRMARVVEGVAAAVGQR